MAIRTESTLASAPALGSGLVDTTRCPHCGTPVEIGTDPFCCAGCRAAWELIHAEGLGCYYEERLREAPRPTGGPLPGLDAGAPLRSGPGWLETEVTVRGLRCASCVWVTERILQTTPGVLDAHVSYGTGRARIRWDPEEADLGAIGSRIQSIGYEIGAAGESAALDRGLLTRLGVAAFCMANIMLLSVASYLGWVQPMDAGFQSLFRWATLILATPVALWAADPFFRTAWHGLATRVVHMDVPIALGVAVMYGHGVVATVAGSDAYLDSMTMLVTLLLAGRVVEARGRQSALRAASTLAARLPTMARRIEGDEVADIPVEGLGVGDRIVVGFGEEVGADGIVVSGEGEARMALITGESELVKLGPGDEAIAGTVLESGSVILEVRRTGRDTMVQQMARALRTSLAKPVGGFRDPLAPHFVVATLAIAGLVFVGWSVWGTPVEAANSALAVLVVACPCALALARPVAAAAGLGAAARRGVLLRSPDSLLALATCDTVVLDKTGTATVGRPQITMASSDALRVAAALERYSIHPVARAIVDGATARGIPLAWADDVEEELGVGVRGTVDGTRWSLGSDGPGRVRLRSDDDRTLTIRLADAARPESRKAVAALEASGLSVVMLSGDTAEITERLAEELGIPTARAGVLPLEKADWVEGARGDGRQVLFVGDGLNDGPAMAAADVGLAMEGGAGSTILAGDGIVTRGNLTSIASAIRAAREAGASVRRSRARAVAYNLVAVGLAAGGVINPLVAAVLMPLSSLMVLVDATRVEHRVERGLP